MGKDDTAQETLGYIPGTVNYRQNRKPVLARKGGLKCHKRLNVIPREYSFI